ncbi:MAG: hypothetical protein RLP14_10340 [Owenweeksia sp.]
MPETDRIYLSPTLFMELVNLSMQTLCDEIDLDKELGHKHSLFWKNHFDDFKKQVCEKFARKGGEQSLKFPESHYFYNRYRAAVNKIRGKKKDEWRGLENNNVRLLLIQCGINGFEAIFESDKISEAAVRSQLDDFDKNGEPYTHPEGKHQQEPRSTTSIIEPTLQSLAGTKWWFYFHGYNNPGYRVLVKLKFFFHEKKDGIYRVELINTKGNHPSYEGTARTDVLDQYTIVCDLKTKNRGSRLLHLKIRNPVQDITEIMLGIFSNFEGSSVYAGSIIMEYIPPSEEDAFDKTHPESFYYPSEESINQAEDNNNDDGIPDNRKSIEESGIHESIKGFFEEKSNNFLKMPSGHIKTKDDLLTWKKNKQKNTTPPE